LKKETIKNIEQLTNLFCSGIKTAHAVWHQVYVRLVQSFQHRTLHGHIYRTPKNMHEGMS